MNTTTFVANNEYQFTVKLEFLAKAKELNIDPKEIDIHSTPHAEISNFIYEYLHNETGPAVVYLKTGEEAYCINGEQVSPEQAETMKRHKDFNDKLLTILEEKE